MARPGYLAWLSPAMLRGVPTASLAAVRWRLARPFVPGASMARGGPAVPDTWLSEEAHQRLLGELDELRTVARPAASAAIGVARAHGDIRENAEYDSAKEEQGKLEARIRQLEELLRTAKIGVAPAGDGAAPGQVVTLDIGGDEETYLLVSSREERSDEHQILSTSSPLGKALVGARAGDVVTADAPSGPYDVTVVSVRSA